MTVIISNIPTVQNAILVCNQTSNYCSSLAFQTSMQGWWNHRYKRGRVYFLHYSCMPGVSRSAVIMYQPAVYHRKQQDIRLLFCPSFKYLLYLKHAVCLPRISILVSLYILCNSSYLPALSCGIFCSYPPKQM